MYECLPDGGVRMKRFLCALLILCMIPACSPAEPQNIIFLIYNELAKAFENKLLPEEYEINTGEDGTEERSYALSDKTKVIMYSYGDNVYQLAVVCYDEMQDDFLQACNMAAITLMGKYNAEALDIIRKKYILTNNGEETEMSYVDGYFLHMKKASFGYMFFVTSIEGFREKHQ